MKRLPKHEAQRIQTELKGKFLSSPTELDVELIHRRNWVAVPVPNQITEQHASWISQASAEFGEFKAVCITTEPDVFIEGYEFDLSAEDILEFDVNCMLRSFLLVPEKLGFALLEEGDYFYVVAGPEAFVEAAVGCELEQARQTFLRYAQTLPEKLSTRQWLERTAERYAIPRAS